LTLGTIALTHCAPRPPRFCCESASRPVAATPRYRVSAVDAVAWSARCPHSCDLRTTLPPEPLEGRF
jgi:hypothetical protein